MLLFIFSYIVKFTMLTITLTCSVSTLWGYVNSTVKENVKILSYLQLKSIKHTDKCLNPLNVR